MHVKSPEELAVTADAQLLASGDAVVDGLTGKLLHLDVVKLSEVAEPLDQLGGDAAVELERETAIRKMLKRRCSQDDGSGDQ